MAIASAGHEIVVGPDRKNTAEEKVVEDMAEVPGHHRIQLYLPKGDSTDKLISIAENSENIGLIKSRTNGHWVAGRIKEKFNEVRKVPVREKLIQY